VKQPFILLITIANITFQFVIYFFSGFIKKNKKRWAFGSWSGKEFRGNTKHLYNYVKNYHKDIEIFWIAKSKNQHEKLLKNGINSVYAYSFNGFKKISTSSVIFCTHRAVDIIPCLTKNSILVWLGHMTFTIKQNSQREFYKKKNYLTRLYNQCLLLFMLIKKVDYGIYSSESTEKNLKCFDKSYPKKPLILGLPKTDYLCDLRTNNNKDSNSKLKKEILGKSIPENEKVILFLPTWRDNRKFSIFNFNFSPDKISNFIKINKCHFYINLHPLSNERKYIYNYNLKNFSLTSFDGNSVDNMLNFCDLFITDYSSLFADYLLFDKPVIFAKFDHQNYVKDRGTKINYDDLPGPKVVDWNELLSAAEKILYKTDSYIEKRMNWKNKVYKNLDGNNCKRITEFFKSNHQ